MNMNLLFISSSSSYIYFRKNMEINDRIDGFYILAFEIGLLLNRNSIGFTVDEEYVKNSPHLDFSLFLSKYDRGKCILF